MSVYVLQKDWVCPDGTILRGAKFRRFDYTDKESVKVNREYDYEYLSQEDSFITGGGMTVYANKRLGRTTVENNPEWFLKEGESIMGINVTKEEVKNSPDWVCINNSPHGCFYEKKDGSAIVVGTWDGKGTKYDVHFKNKSLVV